MGKIVLAKLSNFIRLCSLTVIFLSGTVYLGNAQDYEVPEKSDYEFKDPEDFRKYEGDLIKCTEYLLSTSPKEGGENWAEARDWMYKWISGSPDYTIRLRSEPMMYINKKNTTLLVYFIAGWVNDALVNKRDNEIEGNVAGMHALMKAYQEHSGWKKDKNLDSLIVETEKNEEALRVLVRSWFR